MAEMPNADTVMGYLRVADEEDGGLRHSRFVIARGQTAWNPASTKHSIDGPATIVYTQHPDGGVSALITE